MRKSVLLFVLCANLFSSPKDSTVVQEVHCWRLGQDGLQIDSVAVDTAFYRINNYDRVYKKYPHSFLSFSSFLLATISL